MLSRIRMQVKITVLLVALLVVAVVLNVAWSYESQTAQAKREMLEKTQILDQEMRAVWEFIDANQMRIDTDADGNYNFKNIYCAVAGKSVAAIFMRDTDYVVKYVSLEPRNKSSIADEYETVALESFKASGEDTEVYSIETIDGKQVFRYTSPIYAERSCLSCHGEPAGELDITGYPKEGMQEGDLTGAISIIMPIDLYMQGIEKNITEQSLYFVIVLAILICIAYLAVSYLVRRVEKANERLVQESSYKSDFLAMMSHELKTPLTSILAFAELWEESSDKANDQESNAIVEIRENGYLLLEMVNNILEAARADVGKTELHPEWVDVVDLFSTVESVVSPMIEKKGIVFSSSVDADVPLIYADWEKLRRIIENLTSNSIKFTKPGGTVKIEASYEPDTSVGKAVVMRVSDTGIGIKREDIERLFQKFMQLDQSAQRRYRGSGMGLAVVKDLVDVHGGKVEVYSVYQEGSIFTVSIPVGNEPIALTDEEEAQ